MSGVGWVYGFFAVWGIAGYFRWAKRQDALEEFQRRRDALARITQEERHG